MLDHVSIGVRDIAKSRAFYDAVFAALGGGALHAGDTYAGYGRDVPVFWVQVSERPVPPDMGSGLHFCFEATSRRRWPPSTPPRWRMAGPTTARRDCGPTMGPTTTRPSPSTRRATGSRRTPTPPDTQRTA